MGRRRRRKKRKKVVNRGVCVNVLTITSSALF